ncbi:hypothetical protein [Neoaquamicrobium sediminum]|uniref:hypothetical protein n=1 Tax=Neoaquamicrobium sediminum TaxID=1849104 RepID=UPI00361903A8
MTLTLILHFLMLLACVVAASLLAPRRPGKGHPVEWGEVRPSPIGKPLGYVETEDGGYETQ